MTCLSCNTDLICRLKDYGGDYKPKLQWQNEDGTAHYKTNDGKNFDCIIPNEIELNPKDEESTPIIQNSTVETSTSSGQTNGVEEQLAALNLKVESIYSIIKTQFDEYQERKNQQ